MGNTASVGEKIYRAAKANDVTELQGLCMDMRRNGGLDSTTRSNWLNWTDLEGRTALQIAPKRPSGGSALAEAVAHKQEAMVELLLAYGADPFTENPSGKTPLDIALELRCVTIVRSLERFALFTGYVNMKVLQLKGFSHAAKDRWVVVAPRFTPPAVRSSAVGVVRMMMLIFRNAAEAEPRTKVWLDGATICRMGQEAVLRLHPNHEQPRNAFTNVAQASGPTSSSSPSFTGPSAPVAPPGTSPAGTPVFTHNPFLQDQAASADAGAAAATGLAGLAASAVQAGPTGGSAASGGSDTGGDGDLCVICLTNPKEVGLLHGSSLHRCVCKECAGMMRVGAPCPMCRQTIERVIGVY
eukprot:gene12085-12225_t